MGKDQLTMKFYNYDTGPAFEIQWVTEKTLKKTRGPSRPKHDRKANKTQRNTTGNNRANKHKPHRQTKFSKKIGKNG